MTNELVFRSFDQTELYLKKEIPEGAKAVVAVVHGLCEHQGRYDYLTARFNERGIGTYRFDHRGHGRSSGERTYYKDFNEMVDDANAVVELAKKEYPALPVFLLGHSMGGFCAALFGAKYPGKVRGIVMSGGLTHDHGRLIADVPEGMDPHGTLPNELGEGVCSVKEVVEAYAEDPYNTRTFTFGLCYALNAGVAWLGGKKGDFSDPVLMMHGEKDALVSVRDTYDFFAGVSSTDRQMKIYGGLFHEIFNEYCRDEVIGDALQWILRRV